MAYVPGYEHDIFISYAHRDDEPPAGAQQGWVTTLCQELRKGLSAKLDGPPPEVWMDHRLAMNAALGPELDERLSRSAVLLIVVSPPYLASHWCREERGTFLRLMKERRGAKAAGSVFVIEKDRVEQRPPELSDLVGRPLWLCDDNDRMVTRTLGWPEPGRVGDPYWDQVNWIGTYLAEQLKQLKRGAGAQPSVGSGTDSPEPDARPAVLVARATDDLFEEYTLVLNYLQQAGIHVLPEEAFPEDPEAVRAFVERNLPRAKAFVQLLGPKVGRYGPDWPLGFPGIQLDAAKKSGLPILQWRDARLDVSNVANEGYRQLLDGPNVRACGLEEFKAAIVEEARRPPPAKSVDSDRPVLISAIEDDRPVADALGNWLEQRDVLAMQWVDQRAAAANQRRFADFVKESKGFIVVCRENTDASWLLRQLKEGRKYGSQGASPVRLALYDGAAPDDPVISSPGLNRLDCRRGINEHALNEFVASLRS